MKESEVLEFKETTRELKQSVISLSAMLNKHGHGTLYFGIDNNGSLCRKMIIGSETMRDVSVFIRDHIRPMVTPSVSVVDYEGGKVIKVDAVGNDAPYSAYGRYYIRSSDEDLVLEPFQLRVLFEKTKSGENPWEKEPSGHGLDCVDEDLLIEFMGECIDSGRSDYNYRDMRSALTKLGLMSDQDTLNNAGYYLFSRERPLRLKLAIFNTDERLSFSDIKQFDGNIFECIRQGIAYIQSNMHWSAKIIETERVETPEIPLEAIREIVVNSFAHMKYGAQPYNQIYFTPERISVFNPGGLPEGTEPQTFADGLSPSILRNPVIANVLYLNKSIDAFGTGFNRVFSVCRTSGVKYLYSNSELGFTFQFLRNPRQVVETVSKGIFSVEENRIIDLISENPRITIKELTDETDMTKMRVVICLNSLKECGILSREGARKNGRWVIAHKEQR